MSINEEPIQRTLKLPVSGERAFAIFTAEMARWWPMNTHSVGGDETVEVSVEGRVGGEIAETTRDGSRHVWGTLSVWDPPHRMVSTWHPGGEATDVTELEIRFEPATDGCTLVLEHRGWERASWSAKREAYALGWDPVLASFAALLQAEPSPA